MKTIINKGLPFSKERKDKSKLLKLKFKEQSTTTIGNPYKEKRKTFKSFNAPHNTNHFLIRLHNNTTNTIFEKDEIEDLVIPFGSIKGFTFNDNFPEDDYCSPYSKSSLNDFKQNNTQSTLII